MKRSSKVETRRASVWVVAIGVVSGLAVVTTVTAPLLAQEPVPDEMAVNAAPVNVETLEIETDRRQDWRLDHPDLPCPVSRPHK